MSQGFLQNSINDLPSPAVFEGFLRNNTAIPGAALTPLPINVEVLTNPLITHAAASSDFSFATSGRVVVDWMVTIGNTINALSSSITALFINRGAGFLFEPGTLTFSVHVNGLDGAISTSSFYQFQVNQNDSIRIASVRSTGVGALQFLGSSCMIKVQFFADLAG